jgi:ABC-type multidrug transport system ATPase subunit
VTTHDLREAEYADRVLVIDRGRIALDVRTRDLAPGEGGTLETIYGEAVGHAPRV